MQQVIIFKEILRFLSVNEELLVQTEDLKNFSNKDLKLFLKKNQTLNK